MSTLFPGSGSTRGVPPKLVGGAAPSPPTGLTWVQKYEVDFTSLGAGSDINWMSAPGMGTARSISGGSYSADWRAIDNGSETTPAYGVADLMQLDNGVGLTIRPGGGYLSNMLGADQSCPRAIVKISELIQTLGATDTICFQAVGNCGEDPLIPVGGGGDHFGYCLSISNLTGYGATGLSVGAMAATACFTHGSTIPAGPRWRSVRGAEQELGPDQPGNLTLLEIIVYPYLASVTMNSGVWSGSWPTPSSQTPADNRTGVINSQSGPTTYGQLNPTATGAQGAYVGLGAYAGGVWRGTSKANTVFTNFRALRLE